MQALQTKRKNRTVRYPISTSILSLQRAREEALTRLKEDARRKREALKRNRIKLATAYKDFLKLDGLTAY